MLKPEQRAPFARTLEPLLIETPIAGYLRVCCAEHRYDPLGIGSDPSRFSATTARLADKNRSFRVLYLAENLATALYETVVRYELDYERNRALEPSDYAERVLFTISTTGRRAPVTLLDLTNDNARRYGIPPMSSSTPNTTMAKTSPSWYTTTCPTQTGFSTPATSPAGVASPYSTADYTTSSRRLPKT